MNFAEREGFEPPVPLGTTVFKTAAIDHSAISPKKYTFKKRCKGTFFFYYYKIFRIFFIKNMIDNIMSTRPKT